MAKICSKSVGEFYQHYPNMAIIVTSASKGRENAMAAAWHCALSYNPPIYGVAVSPRRLTYELILESQGFAINFLPIDKAELIAAAGGSKGSEVDKFKRFGLATEEPLKIGAPVLADAYACYECKLIDHKTYGDHEWFAGEVVAVHTLREAFSDSGILDLEKIKPALYLGAEHYLTVSVESLRHLDRTAYGKTS